MSAYHSKGHLCKCNNVLAKNNVRFKPCYHLLNTSLLLLFVSVSGNNGHYIFQEPSICVTPKIDCVSKKTT